ncbi:hypothetical protein LTR64_008150 [Lithohypha guttulata]|uniref:Prefoldin subunit 4 n=1 Tax=Lithohypha guttulata TaxID=1690604 RepID=A0AAN7T812_9EURO|nr:hypothetical protein LTR51_008302 [Lithohypha guttulata]KAK5091627.1 hypothetical protein LTR05_001812 [Lithohypha guttulata]
MMLSRRVLTKEEESETTENEVTKEDQDKINEFSRLHNRSKALEEELESKKKEKEDLEEITTELELADEDEPIQYKVGDTFYAVKLPIAQKLLETSTGETEEEVTRLEDELSSMKEGMDSLKAHLYARFGRGINLEG